MPHVRLPRSVTQGLQPTTHGQNDNRFEDLLKETKKLAATQAIGERSLAKLAGYLVKASQDGVIDHIGFFSAWRWGIRSHLAQIKRVSQIQAKAGAAATPGPPDFPRWFAWYPVRLD